MAASPPAMIDAYTAHQIDLVRLAAGEAKKADAFLIDLIDYLNARLAREGETIRNKKRLTELLADVKARQAALLTGYMTDVLADMPEIVAQELEFNAETVSAVVQDYAPAVPTVEQAIVAVTRNPLLIGYQGGAIDWQELTNGWIPDETKRVADRITAGFYTGEPTTQIARAISGTKAAGYKDGLLNVTRANAQAIAKTAINHMATQTRAAFNEANSDLIVGEEVVATLDSRTSAYCRAADGKVYLYKDGPFPRPPYHFACRTTLSPVLSEEFDFTRAGRTRPAVADGQARQVSASTTYYEWLKRQPAHVIDSALGKKQGLVFRNAGLSAEEFRQATVNQFGQPLSLAEMADHNKQIAEYLRNL